MAIRPLNDTIFLEPEPYKAYDSNPEIMRILAEGVLSLPEQNTVEKVSNIGTIISWGDRCRYKEHFEVGKRVMFKQFGGAYFYHEGKKLLSILEEELLAIYD